MSSDFDEEYYRTANPDVVLAIKRGLVRTGWEHYMRFGKDEGRRGLPPAGAESARLARSHRDAAARHATGRGVEIGALASPCPVAAGATVVFCDRFSADEARGIFSGLADAELVEVERVLNLDEEGLASFDSESLDFSILCNVLQHVANPIRVLQEAFRVVRAGGHVILSVSDHRFSFEASRPPTAFEHVLDEYLGGVTVVTDAHYVDLLVLFCPSEIQKGVSGIAPRLEELRQRLEPAHVWDSAAFSELLKRGLRVVDVEAEPVYEVTGDETRSEHFVVLRKDRQMLG